MSIRQGNNVLAAGQSLTQDLFDFKWSDHILNDVQWLRADTFSWQEGSMFELAYQHLVADKREAYESGNRGVQETIAGITINYELSADGHKIVDADYPQEVDKVQDIFEATGESWFYILDETNKRFKLPRTNNQECSGEMYLYFFVGNFSQDFLINQYKKQALENKNITNCLTEVPQDIKLSLSTDYKLTLHKGSKLYFPNGFACEPVEPEKVNILQGYNWIDCSGTYDVVNSKSLIVLMSSTGHISVSENGGNTFSTPTLYSELASMDSQKSMVCNGSNYVGNEWIVLDKNGKLSTSTDLGATWTTPTEISTLSSVSNKWYLICQSSQLKKFVLSTDGYVSTSSDGGTTWSTPVRISSNLSYGEWTSLYYFNKNSSYYVAITNKGYISQSSDFSTWSTPVLNENLSSVDGNWIYWQTLSANSVSESNGTRSKPIIAILSDNGYMSVSDDVINWSKPKLIDKAYRTGRSWKPFGSNSYLGNSSNFISVSNNGYILRSLIVPNFDEYYTKKDKVFEQICGYDQSPRIERMCLFVKEDQIFEHSYQNMKAYWYSQDTDPASTLATLTNNAAFWYNTLDNVIKFTYDRGEHWSTYNMSLPIADIENCYGDIKNIKRVFNGIGTIGSMVYLLPGVKGLVPNGRNQDGSIINEEINNEEVSIRDLSSIAYTGRKDDQVDHILSISSNKLIGRIYHCFGVLREICYKYDYEENKNYEISSWNREKEIYDQWKQWKVCVVGKIRCNPDGLIDYFEKEEVFQPVDYSEFKSLSDELSILKISDCVKSVPNSVFLKLNDGNITLEAKSIIYIPYGFSNSPLGAYWTSLTEDTNLGSNHNWEIIVSNGVNYAAISQDAYISVSSDGITWGEAVQIPSLVVSGSLIFKATYGNGKVVVLYNNGYIATSSNLTDWTTPTKVFNVGTWDSICYGNGKYVAVSNEGYVSTSENGTTWTTEVQNENLILSNDSWDASIYYKGKYVVISVKGYLSTSEDGVNWTKAKPSLINLYDMGVHTNYAWTDLCIADNKLYAINASGKISITSDLDTWVVPRQIFTASTIDSSGIPQSIEYNGSELVVITMNGYTSHSRYETERNYQKIQLSQNHVYSSVDGIPNGRGLLYYNATTANLYCKAIGNFEVGINAPTGSINDHVWWDLTNNWIKWYNGSEGQWESTRKRSLPIAVVQGDGTKFTSIEDIFNSIGFMGTSVFALPGVKVISPNGTNSDGSFRNKELITENVLYPVSMSSNSTYGHKTIFFRTSSTFVGNSVYDIVLIESYNQEEEPLNPVNNSLWYNPKTNKYKQYSLGSGSYNWIDINLNYASVGELTYSDGIIQSFNSKTPVRLVDVNNRDYLTHLSMPSTKYVTIGNSTTTTGTVITAPADGYINAITNASTNEQGWIDLNISGIYDVGLDISRAGIGKVMIPISKGQRCTLTFGGTTINTL